MVAAQVTQKLTGLLRTHKSALLEEYCQGSKEGDPGSGQPSHAMKVPLTPWYGGQSSGWRQWGGARRKGGGGEPALAESMLTIQS